MPSAGSSAADAVPAHSTTASKRRRSLSPCTTTPTGVVPMRSMRVLKAKCTPEPCVPWRSSCANRRQLPARASGRWMAPASGASGDRPGSIWRATSASISRKATPLSRSTCSAGWSWARSCSVRSSTRRPWLASKSSSCRWARACKRLWLYCARRSSAAAGALLACVALRQRLSQAQLARLSPPDSRSVACGPISRRAWPNPGTAQGLSRWGASRPAVAKLASSAAALRCSKTVTSWPSLASSYAVVTPIIPAPTMAIFMKFGCFWPLAPDGKARVAIIFVVFVRSAGPH